MAIMYHYKELELSMNSHKIMVTPFARIGSSQVPTYPHS